MGSTNHIMIPPYTVDGIEQIINQRAQYSLVGGTFSPKIIRLIAEKAAPSGDARRGIELLSAAVERCEFRQDAQSAREILVEDIHEPNDGVALQIGIKLEIVDDLSAHQMLVLLALCRRLKTEGTMSMGDVESLYAVICEEYEQKQKSHTTIWKYIKYLEQQQLIDSNVSNVSDGRGRTTHLSMPHHLPADLSSRLELLLPKRLRR
jgi:Cdc6-like AAA superfamily ATPase